MDEQKNHPEGCRCGMCQGGGRGCSCGAGGGRCCWGGGHGRLLWWVIGLFILFFVFCVGVRAGELRSEFRGYGYYPQGNTYPTGYPMMGGQVYYGNTAPTSSQ